MPRPPEPPEPSAQPVRLPRSHWPATLNDLPEPPDVLYLTGQLPTGPGVAVVGTRHPSAQAAVFAARLARGLAEAGLWVVSGGAEGIDQAAHQGALDAGGGTLVVAPAGWRRPYPERCAELFRAVVASGGGYLSLCDPETPATRARFFPRNACLVALSSAVVVVEAGFRSGARNAAKHARQLGRKLFVVPSAPWVGSGRGCIAELRAGASLLESVKDVLGYLEQRGVHALGPQLALPALALPEPVSSEQASRGDTATDSATPPASDRSTRVLVAVRAGANTLDAVCTATGLAAPEVQRQVFDLRLLGLLVMEPSGALRVQRA